VCYRGRPTHNNGGHRTTERLQRFSLFSRMKQFALVFITHLVTPEEMRDSRMVFEKIALGDTGTAGGAELHAALRSSGHTAREDEVGTARSVHSGVAVS